MKGAVAALVIAASLLACVGFVMANPPLPEPLQYEQFCDNQKVSGTGAIDISTSVVDKKIALEYHNVMAGDGDLELDQTHAFSDKAINQGPLFNESHNSSLNLLEKEKLTYNAKKAPLSGEKYLNSKAFYGGIGADVREIFSVNQMEKDQTTFFASTAPKTPPKPCNPPTPNLPPTPCCPPNPRDSSIQNYPLTSCAHMPGDSYGQIYPLLTYVQPNVTPEASSTANLDKGSPNTQQSMNAQLKAAGLADKAWGNDYNVSRLMTNSAGTVDPAHLIGIDTKNSFNGTWGVDANWHKIFYKDIKLHEQFTGTFEAEKMVKFHENPVPEEDRDYQNPCKDIDC
jgi:hypothetical protein